MQKSSQRLVILFWNYLERIRCTLEGQRYRKTQGRSYYTHSDLRNPDVQVHVPDTVVHSGFRTRQLKGPASWVLIQVDRLQPCRQGKQLLLPGHLYGEGNGRWESLSQMFCFRLWYLISLRGPDVMPNLCCVLQCQMGDHHFHRDDLRKIWKECREESFWYRGTLFNFLFF